MAYQVANGVQCNTTVCCHGYLSGNREINMMMIMISEKWPLRKRRLATVNYEDFYADEQTVGYFVTLL